MILRFGFVVLLSALVAGPVLAKQTLAPQIVQAIKSWQQCTAAAYKAERQVKTDKNEAAEASFAACQTQFDTVVERAAENGLAPDAVRLALTNSKTKLKMQLTAQD